MRHATALLAGLLLALPAPSARAGQEPPPPPDPAPAASPAPADAKVAGKDVDVPRRTRFVQPVYPPEAQALGQRGIVILELVIDETGKVASADVVRSVPPFDEASVRAARQWEYEVTRVDGRPVKVRLTVPITFALRLPDMTREAGIPELRQGAAPLFPTGAPTPATVVADVTLHPDGTVAEAAVREGDSPYAEALLQTLRTWRFASEPTAGPLAFQVKAEYLSGSPPRVDLKLYGLHPAERRATMNMDTVPAEPDPAPAPPTPAADPVAAPPAPEPPSEAAAPEPQPEPPAAPDPASEETPAPSTPPPDAAPASGPPPSTPAAPTGTPTPPPVEVIPGGVPGVPRPGVDPAPPPPPAEPGISAVRDVNLGPGVPDLTRGRRPVAPPFARMSSVSGTVKVQFSVDAAGSSSVQNVSGPELLKEAARAAVATWTFRRTSPERVYLVASFKYEGDRAEAEVARAE